MEVVTFTIIVDDIVYPDGSTTMACLGGGGPQTAFGVKLWLSNEERIGLAAGVGSDFPPSCQGWLKEMGIDDSGILIWSFPTLRAWQILEEDGRRTQVWRVHVGDEVWDMLRPTIKDLPPPYRKAKAYHVGVHPSGRDVSFIKGLRSTGAEVVSVEVYTHALDILTRSELRALISAGNIFSPNEKEAASLVGPGLPLEMIHRLVELGAEVVSLRRGVLGCIVHRADTGETWKVPAFHTIFNKFVFDSVEADGLSTSASGFDEAPAKVVFDPTGCGNTFCGGFLAGWLKTKDLHTAALWGSVAASFMLEFQGVPPPPISNWKKQAEVRLHMLRPYAQQIEDTKVMQ